MWLQWHQKINNSSLSLSLLTASTEVLEVKTKQGNPRKREEPPEWMGPAHTNRELKPRKRRNNSAATFVPLTNPPPPQKNALWKVLVTARGGSTPRNPKGILLLSAWCFPLGCSGKGFANGKAGVKSPENPACLPPNSGYLAPEGCLLQLCGKPGRLRAGSQAETETASGFWSPAPCRYQNVPLQEEVARPDPARALRLLCRQSLPRWLLGEVRGF